MKKITIGLILIYTLLNFKCGDYYNAKIHNSLEKDINVTLILEKKAIEIYNSNPYQPLFEIDEKKGLKLIYFNKEKGIAKIMIPSEKDFEIEFGTGFEPNFDLILEIIIVSEKDTIAVKSKKELKNAFRKTDDNLGTYILNIKKIK
jgi:hypothetical protein